jgi:serine protease Do
MHYVAVSLISAATVVVCMWGTDMRCTAPGGRRAAFAGRDSAVDGSAVDYRGAAAGTPDAAGPADFVEAARIVVPATVHIVAASDDLQSVISGSGAIISQDGYIVTNNHVIDGAGVIRVMLANKKTLQATLVGGDPNTDLAVLKVDAAELPFLLYGNSEDVKVGQWVLAVGYPLYLQVTATAGIVSAIGNNLGASLGQWSTHIDSFIQTDAAVNLGNSGGPLVNTAGRLIGINTAMASPNGAYTGYSFAIPASVVRPVVNELIAHGSVKKR